MNELKWTKRTENADSPYPEDMRVWWICEEFELEITKEFDGKYWLRHQSKPLGIGPRLKDAKEAARRFVRDKLSGQTA